LISLLIHIAILSAILSAILPTILLPIVFRPSIAHVGGGSSVRQSFVASIFHVSHWGMIIVEGGACNVLVTIVWHGCF
jgi:hypothetical protein